MNVKKGKFGYIVSKKKRMAAGVLAMLIVGIAVFLTGYFLNNMSNRNIFTVAAVMFVLPGAKFLVGFIVVFPYKSVTKEKYHSIKAHVGEGMELYTDMVITSAEKVMNLDFVAVGNKRVICLVGKEGQEISYIREYLSKGVDNWGSGYKVKVLDSEKLFVGELDSIKKCQVNEEEEKNVKSFLLSLVV